MQRRPPSLTRFSALLRQSHAKTSSLFDKRCCTCRIARRRRHRGPPFCHAACAARPGHLSPGGYRRGTVLGRILSSVAFWGVTVNTALPILTLAFCTVALACLALFRAYRYKWVIGLVLVVSLAATTYYNILHDPYALAWLCNFTAVLALISYFQYSPRVFDVFVYFAWTGDLFTLLGWDNPLCPPLATHPVAWTGFWLKHISPLMLTIFMFRVEGRRVTPTGVRLPLSLVVVYAFAMYGYNLLFDQNILDLMHPTIPLDQAFGPWPIYVGVNVLLALCWYAALHQCLCKLELVVATPAGSRGSSRSWGQERRLPQELPTRDATVIALAEKLREVGPE